MTYQVAFAQLADPYAWMLRGLMEMGWEDISLSPETYPQIKGRGIDYARLLNPMSRFGLRLVTLALDEHNEWYRAAGSYEFEARLVNDAKLSYSILLRSDEMAFSQLFQWNAGNPMYVVEDIHRTIVQRTHEFIKRTKQRKDISSIDLQEMLNHPIIPPPPTFTEVMTIRCQRGLNLNTAIQEGLWISTAPFKPKPEPPQKLPTPSFSSNHGTSIPTPQTAPSISPQPTFTIQAGQGRGQLLGQQGLASQEHSSAMVIVEPAVKWLTWTAYIGMVMGILAMVNSMFTLFMMSTGSVVRGSTDSVYLMVVILSAMFGLFGTVGGFLSQKQIPEFQALSKSTMRMFPVLFALCYPLSWFIGIPAGAFAIFLLRKPLVQSALRSQ